MLQNVDIIVFVRNDPVAVAVAVSDVSSDGPCMSLQHSQFLYHSHWMRGVQMSVGEQCFACDGESCCRCFDRLDKLD